MIFSEKIRLLRKKQGLTQEKFAKAIGVSRQSVYKWEDGQSYPEIPKLLKMKELFREFALTIDDLFDDNMSVSDSGFLKTNAEVEYENAHRKVRKVRKDKGIKTGIPPHYKDGTPVVRRKKKPEEAPVAAEIPIETFAVETETPITPVGDSVWTVETPVEKPVATPAEQPSVPAEQPAAPAAAAPRTPSFRTRAAAPSFSHRDAQASAMAAINARRNKATLLSEEDNLLDEDK